MNKTITISYDEPRLDALRLYLGLKEQTVEAELLGCLEQLYQKTVPVNVRSFLEMRQQSKPEPPKPKKPKPPQPEAPGGEAG